MPTDLGRDKVAQEVDPIEWPYLYRKGQLQVMRELTHHQPHQSSQQIHASHHRFKSKAEKLLAEGQARFRTRRSTVFNCRIIVKKHLQLPLELLTSLMQIIMTAQRLNDDNMLFQYSKTFAN
ncbi:hypothetical protein DPMN_117147 [Dreissena polymorpha]|uniref:Uncharacterized protein n=1 Tax=Dreissena polymorpha TaxID=45954 RepID=A0A9D4KPC9_DREPO|nr:hypothetical protein DPMN_117147 [Dreissena polymorpha]